MSQKRSLRGRLPAHAGLRPTRLTSGATRLASGASRRAALVCLLMLAWVHAAVPLAQADEVRDTEVWPTPLTLDRVLARAEARSPSLQVAGADRDIAAARSAHTGRLDDPRISYEASGIPVGNWDFDSSAMSGHQLTLKQRIPFPGALAGARASGRSAADAAAHDYETARISLRAATEAAFAELGFTQRALTVTERNADLVAQIATMAERRYELGEGTQSDVLRTRVQHTRMVDETIAREAALRIAEARLAALLDLPLDGPLPMTAGDNLAAPVPNLERLLAELDRLNPELRAMHARVAESTADVRAVRGAGVPDIDLGVGYRIRASAPADPVSGQDFFSAGVTVRLPVDRRGWSGRSDEALASQRRAQAQLRSARARIRSNVQIAHAALSSTDASHRLVRTGLVPQATQSLASSQSAYQVGRTDLLSLLDSQVSLLRAELQEVRVRADRSTAFASLEAAVGRTLR